MKLSNKILIGFFGLTLFYMLGAFTEIRLKGERIGIASWDENHIKTIPTDKITHLICTDLSLPVTIRPSSDPRMELMTIKDTPIPEFTYKITGDTLRINTLKMKERGFISLTIFAPDHALKNVYLQKSSINITKLKQQSLSIIQSGGQVTLRDCHLDSLTLQMNAAQAHSYTSTVKHLKGVIVNNSQLHVNEFENIQLKKDKSSRLY